MKTPMVSIVIPVYNGANFLGEAVASAIDQTYGNKEIIIINDGSSDDGETESIAQSFGHHVRYFCKENEGVASALNRGLREMTGDFFLWLSHDDIISKNRIETDMHMVQQDQRIRITFCRLSVIDSQGGKIKDCHYPLQSVTNPREALLLGGVDMGTMTIHKSCFDRVGLFDESNLTTQDVIMSLSLSRHFPFFYNPFATKFSREHPQRGTNTMRAQIKKDSLRICEFLHQQCSFMELFPDMEKMTASEIAAGWEWLGKFYRHFGAADYSEEAFIKMNHYLSPL